MITSKALDEIIKRLFPSEFFHNSWKVTDHDDLPGDYAIVIRPKAVRKILLTQEIHETFAGDQYKMVEWLYRRVSGAQELICDELDQSIGREKRSEGPIPVGKCDYCGAPYGHQKGK